MNEQVFNDVRREMSAQRELHGETNRLLPDGTGPRYERIADRLKAECDEAADSGQLTWVRLLTEEIFEACAETDLDKLRYELIQAIGVATQWVETIDERECAKRQSNQP